MLTRGAHFAAAARKLREVFGDVPVIGCFIARTVIPNPFDDIDIDDLLLRLPGPSGGAQSHEKGHRGALFC
ncbi:hypothetical protein AB3X96_41635 [Paraburkholderia sp. BR13439]|uniref:Uncharacterized protein n=1 Tax=Paraburkholderia youngii TaxID=2782701 RepID=A0A7Y6K8M2_9BURK|nr:hypothetical protein [Paraburkholderia youngii]